MSYLKILPVGLVAALVALFVYFQITTQVNAAFVMTGTASGFSSQWPNTDFSKTQIELHEVTSGGPPRDGIPAIDNPVFVSTDQASRWMHGNEPVIVVERNGKARAYPLQILIYHEIVNDRFEGLPLSVTFCPLCNASIVFDRRFAGKILDFGTTGNLRKSDLLMYDRQTESWWQQFTGEAVVGRYSGEHLTEINSKIVAFDVFTASYPGGEVLSRNTGYVRPYGTNPYRGYDRVGEMPFLFTDPIDGRLPAMERVLGIKTGLPVAGNNNGQYRLYSFAELDGTGLVHDRIGSQAVVIFVKDGLLSVLDKADISNSHSILSAVAYDRRIAGRELTFELSRGSIQDKQTGSQWNMLGKAIKGELKGTQLKSVDNGVHFAFAWLAFNPDAQIYKRAKEQD